MRNRFSELIEKGVASFEEKPVGSPIPTLDPMVKTYNNLWGALTDTHMSKVDDGYIITGTFVKTPYWERFKYCSFWGSTNIKLGSGYNSLEQMIRINGYKMTPCDYNGDYVIKISKADDAPETESPVPGEECCDICVPCSSGCPVTYSLGESQIPHPFKEYFTEAQSRDIFIAWEDAKGDANKIIENLKSSREVDESKLAISSDNQYLLVNENVKIKLN